MDAQQRRKNDGWRKKRKRPAGSEQSRKRSAPKGISLPLHSAARRGEVSIVCELLSEASARVVINARDEHGRTALHLAAHAGESGVLKVLLENGADVNAGAMDAMTALHFAAQSGSAECSRLLIENGAEKDAAMTNNQRTPLHLAVLRSHSEVITTLIQHGASVDVLDSRLQSPRTSPLVLDAINTHRSVSPREIFLDSTTTQRQDTFRIDSPPVDSARKGLVDNLSPNAAEEAECSHNSAIIKKAAIPAAQNSTADLLLHDEDCI